MAELDVSKLQKGIDLLTKSVNDGTSSYKEQMRELKKTHSKYTKSALGEAEERQRIAKKDIDAKMKHLNALNELREASRDTKRSLDDLTDNTEENTKKIKSTLEDQIEQFKSFGGEVDDISYQLALAGDNADNLRMVWDQLDSTMQAHSDIQNKKIQQNIQEASTQDVIIRKLGELGGAIKSTAKNFFSMSTAIGFASTGMFQLFDEIQTSMKNNVGMYGMVGDGLNALSLGISNVDAQELVIANKQMINSMGGTKEAFEVLDRNKDAMFTLTGSYKEGAATTMNLMDTMTNLGVNVGKLDPSQLDASLSKSANQLNRLSVFTNKSTVALAKEHQELMKDEGMQKELRKMSKAQRVAFSNDIMAFKEHTARMGMSTEQTGKFIETVKQLKGMDTKSRLKAAAKAQAVAGAMGISGGEEFANLLRKGKLEGKDLERFNELGAQFKSAFSDMAGGGIGQQMMGDQLQSQLGPSVMAMVNASADTKMLEGKALTNPEAEARVEAAAQIRENNKGLENLNAAYRQLTTYLNDGGMKLLTGLVAGMGSLLVQIATVILAFKGLDSLINVVKTPLKLLGGVASSAGSMLMKGATFITGILGNIATTIGTAFMNVGKVLLPFGVAFSAVGFAVSQLYDSITTGSSWISRLVSEYLPNFYDSIGEAVNWVVELGSSIADVVGSIIDFFQPVIDLVTTGISKLWDGLKATWNGFMDMLSNPTEFAEKLGKSILDAFFGMIESIKNGFMSAVNAVKNFVGLGDDITGQKVDVKTAESIADTFSVDLKDDSPEELQKKLKEMKDAADEAAKEMEDVKLSRKNKETGFFGGDKYSEDDLNERKKQTEIAKAQYDMLKLLVKVNEDGIVTAEEGNKLKAQEMRVNSLKGMPASYYNNL